VILAASRGEELGALTADRPKCMLDVRGRPLLRRLVGSMQSAGVRDVTVVRGYKKSMVNLPAIRTVDNDLHASTGEAASLACAEEVLNGPCVIAYGDILFRQHILDRLLAHPGDVVLAVDGRSADREGVTDRPRDLVACSQPFTEDYLDESEVTLTEIGHDIAAERASGEWIGLAKLSGGGARTVRDALGRLRASGRLTRASLVDLLADLLAAEHRISVVYVGGHWLDVDDAFDLARAREFP
jgi:phosphoenolpyruvate phosphomutase